MTAQLTRATSDAMTTLDLTPKCDVTFLPRKIEELLEETEKPLHRAILKNYFKHALLEISGYWDQILVPEPTIDEPVYRISERGVAHVLTGHTAVESFYREIAETRQNVMAARTLNICVISCKIVQVVLLMPDSKVTDAMIAMGYEEKPARDPNGRSDGCG
jgi:hypothetical protein